ncbi:putative arylformamidase [Actinoplanes sp. SE50]|uniref:alpha/beta hydrolase n=1 Tax=unclassified Actinoplanes TaxID=2626549 RepID=UPI00023ECA21|nr:MULTISPECIES: alpha/beta hydrolase [unclassified Actinoplanes]AEV87112.1 putative arylformamidase [Actinoplanes sp. SE50/110]ATO85510.1 putative arylformamidase [Actinoplanes sp. SE50]SLM02922.1 putative arylformamidase [Actinoplanes sp. SE50/110]
MSITQKVLRYGDSSWQRIDIYEPGDSAPRCRAVLIHGGFWRHDRTALDLEPLACALVARGCGVAVLEYRPVWDGGAFPASVQDCVAAMAALEGSDERWRDAVVTGHSAGGHLALSALAGRAGKRRVVLLAPVTDLESAAELEVGDGAIGHFLAKHHAVGGRTVEAVPVIGSADVTELVVVQAENDQAVPSALMDRQVARWRHDGLPVTHHLVAGARHMHLVNPQRGGSDVTMALLTGAELSTGNPR